MEKPIRSLEGINAMYPNGITVEVPLDFLKDVREMLSQRSSKASLEMIKSMCCHAVDDSKEVSEIIPSVRRVVVVEVFNNEMIRKNFSEDSEV